MAPSHNPAGCAPNLEANSAFVDDPFGVVGQGWANPDRPLFRLGRGAAHYAEEKPGVRSLAAADNLRPK